MIVTGRARLLMLLGVSCMLVGLVEYVAALVQFGVALLLWLGMEWCLFRYRANFFKRRATATRHVLDRTAHARLLWLGRPAKVSILIEIRPILRWLPGTWVAIEECIPAGVELPKPATPSAQSLLGPHKSVQLRYALQPETAGAIRFIGVRCVLEDFCGLFIAERFLPLPQKIRVLPLSQKLGSAQTIRKPRNTLPPPGTHRIATPGPGSELLDIREYVPGDPPKSIAWKVSARRDGLMTKQFETEVPIRCQIFLDMAHGTRLGYPGPCLAGRLIEVATSVSDLLVSQRDGVGISIFDGQKILTSPSSSNRRSLLAMMDSMARAIDEPIPPVAAELEPLMDAGFDLARLMFPEEVYAALLSLRGRVIPRSFKRQRRLCLAMIVSARYSLHPWAIGELVQQDGLMAYWLQQLLCDHGIPFLGSRYGDEGTSLFAEQEKILQLARMLTHQSARSRDSELFLVLAELCQAEYDLGPLINAIKLATARRHRVAVLCAWPPGMGLRDETDFSRILADSELVFAGAGEPEDLEAAQRSKVYRRLRTELAKMRVPLASTANGSAIQMIAAELDMVRSHRAGA